MDFYKKIIKNKKLRFKIISLFKFVPDKLMLKFQYRVKCGRKLNLENPERYTEKIQWYKLNYRDPVMQQCADKYLVREYVKSKGLEGILNDLYAVFEKPEDISLENLPEKFVLKLSNGSGTNYICKDKNEANVEEIRKMFFDFKAQSGASAGREWVYTSEKEPVIIAEQFLEDGSEGLCDYKFLCFNGKPEYILFHKDRFTDQHTKNIYDINWKNLNIINGYPCCKEEILKPENFEEMLKISEILSEDFPAARVDLYNVNGKIYF